jgi:hypothetical protein
MRVVSLASMLGLSALALAGCLRPVDSNCLQACKAENACPGEDTNCSGLCGAVPDDCEAEISGYWDCAAEHLEEACDSFPSCRSRFVDLSTCVGIYCLTHPLDSDCYYWK